MKKRMKPIYKLLLTYGFTCCFALILNAQCGDIMYDYSDPVICSVAPNPGGNIDIVVSFTNCNFPPEVDNGDGTLTVEGLSLFIDPNGANTFVGLVLESATIGSSACGTTPLMVPANMTCDPITAEFGATVTTFNVEAATGLVNSSMPNAACNLEIFTVTINPNLSIQVDDGADNCGTATAQLVAADGTLCGDPVTATCTEDGDITLTLGETYDCADNTTTVTCADCAESIIEEPVDVCNCDNGIDLDGDEVVDLASETITIAPGTAPYTVTGYSDGLVDMSGAPLDIADIQALIDAAIPDADGTISISAYLPADGVTVFSIEITDDSGAVGAFTKPSGCPSCATPDDVPTVGEWGLIILGLMMSITAVIGIRQRRKEVTYG